MNDKRFNVLLGFAALVVVFIFAGFLFTLVVQSLPAVKQEGAAFLYGSEWNPVTTRFGALPFIIGTLMTSAIALAIAIPLSLSAGIVMGEYVNSILVRSVLNTLINVLASIPSVVFGLWGIEVVIPLVRSLAMSVGAPPYGAGILSASLVLAIMIIPYMSSMTREALVNVHAGLREGAYALGLTKQEVVTGIALPFAKNSIFAGILLSLGRALGETMAVTMLIGNATRIPTSLFSLGNTLASVIASQFNEAASDVHRSAMMGLALILFVITMIIGWFGRTLMRKGMGAHGE
ncbi:MAG: phosphate ABC transporter permease subunit PstC [Rectinema sp.]